jgi:hypothetical protein
MLAVGATLSLSIPKRERPPALRVKCLGPTFFTHTVVLNVICGVIASRLGSPIA